MWIARIFCKIFLFIGKGFAFSDDRKPRRVSRPQARNEPDRFSGGVYAGKTPCAKRSCDLSAKRGQIVR
jgi:hypothetical protein